MPNRPLPFRVRYQSARGAVTPSHRAGRGRSANSQKLMREHRWLQGDSQCVEAVALDHLQIMHALRSLPRRHRALLLLKEWEGWSMAEIAAALGWSETRVKNELYKARRALAEWRRQEADEGENR